LVALGLWLLWRLAWPAIFSSEYGLVLVVKLAAALGCSDLPWLWRAPIGLQQRREKWLRAQPESALPAIVVETAA
jgi:hypothetical protein